MKGFIEMAKEKVLLKENCKSTSELHKNHRARMREKVLKNGAETFHDHELLEMLLFACESRRNTNDTAHELLEKFGSLRGVLTANADSLRCVQNVKDAATSHILVVREILKRVNNESISLPSSFKNYDELGNYFVEKFKLVAVEELYLVLFDNGMRMLECVKISEGTVNSTPENMRKLMKIVAESEASSAVIAHNHPGGKLIASPEDAITTRTISTMLGMVGVKLADHILVAEDKYTSIMYPEFGL